MSFACNSSFAWCLVEDLDANCIGELAFVHHSAVAYAGITGEIYEVLRDELILSVVIDGEKSNVELLPLLRIWLLWRNQEAI